MAGHITRPPVKRTLITRTLRQQIIEGKLPAGSLLPSRLEMCRTFNASIHTVQRAMERLIEDKFIVSLAGNGTYVADRLPHLTQFALVIPHNPEDGYAVWSRFWQALTLAGRQIKRETNREFSPSMASTARPIRRTTSGCCSCSVTSGLRG